MTQNVKMGLMAIFALTLIWMMTQIATMKSENSQLQEKLITLQKDASHYALLKKRWDKKNSQKALIKKLSKVKAFDKRFSKRSNEVIVYKNLKSKMLDRLSYIIFSSDEKLVSVAIEKEKAYVNLRVEMKR